MLMQNFGVTNKEHYGMLWYFWSGQLIAQRIAKRYKIFKFRLFYFLKKGKKLKIVQQITKRNKFSP